MLLGLPLLAAVTLSSQSQDPPAPPAPASRVLATRAAQPPVIDGRVDDAVWREAQPITGFQEWRPSEGDPPKLPTEAKIAYDAANLYVFVRAFDPHPDSIITVLARRDYFTPSDMIWLFLDSYHDRRTGYEFGVNPSGVKLDAQIYNDGNEDFAWDAVWDVATHVDSLGWTAEFRIPLSQLRYGRQRSHTFGFTIDRDLYRYAQRVSWPLFRQSKAGFVSQLGEISGLDDLEAPRRLEAAPYFVTKNVSEFTKTGIGRTQDVAAGGDLKYRVASNLTLDATFNPDFGQVEADPGVLNLSAFETFFSERRPFFVAGRGLFQFDVNCNDVNCSSEGLVYSRRIGRAPELAGTYSDTTSPAFTRILGAGKLTGRLPSGLTIGVLDAVTQHVTGAGGVTIEPTTNYGVLRLRQDLRGGESSVGGIVTAVNRDNDAFTSPYLRRNAYVGAADFRHRFTGGRFEISGSLDLSRVAGSATRCTTTSGRTRRSPTTRRERRSQGTPRSCRAPRWAARTCWARPATSDAPPVSRSTTWATYSALTSSRGAPGWDTSIATSAPFTSAFNGMPTGGNTGRRRDCPKSGRSTRTRTSRSATPGRSMPAARWASWARRTAIPALAAARPCGRIPTSRRGPV